MRDRRQRATIAIGWLALLLLWEVAGRLQWVADGALPSPSGVLRQLTEDWDDYPPHIWATVRTSLIGFLIGNAVAVLCGFLMASWRPVGRLLSGINVTLFAMPPIALTPILVIAFDGDAPRIVLAALATYYPTMVATVVPMVRKIGTLRPPSRKSSPVLRLLRDTHHPNAIMTST